MAELMKSGHSLMAEETKPQGQGANSRNSASANPAAYFPQHAKSADPFLVEVKEKCSLCGDLETVFHFFESWDLAVKLRYSCNKCRRCWFLGLTLEDDCGVKAQSSAPSFSSSENSRSQSQPQSHNLGSLHNDISALSSATAEAPQTTADQVVQLQQVKEKCSFCGSREINFCWYESWQSDSVKIRYFCYTCGRFWIQHFILVDDRGRKAPSFASSFSSSENSSFQLQPQWHNLGSPQNIYTTNSATAKALYTTAYQVEVGCSLCEIHLFEYWDPVNLQAKYYCNMCGGIWIQGSDPGVDCGGIAPSSASSFSSENSRLQSQPQLYNLRLSQNISTIKSATVSVPYTTAYQASWKAESSSGSGEIAGLMKSADSLKIEESKPQGQGETSRKTACPNPPAQKPAANRPPHAENAAAVQGEQGKSSVGNQMTQAKRKPESPGRSGEIPELMKSVDSLKVEESKPQGQQATSGKTAPANPLAEKPAANCPPRAENAAAVLAKEGKSTVRNQMMQAKRKPESPGRSGEIPELTKSVDSLKVEESKPQGQEATSGKTAPANPLAEKPAANRPPRAENAAAVLAKEGKSTVRNQMTQAKRKPESPGRSGEIPELMKSVDSLTVKESKPQGQEATSGKTAPANPPAEKPAANRPPHAENAAAVLAKQGKSSVANQMMQAKWKPESPGRSCENPELTRSVDSLKVEESKPQEQEATSGRTAPANPPAVKPAANHPPHDENAAAARAKLVGGSTTKQKSEALRKRDKEKRMKQKKRQQQKAATKGKLAAAVAAADTEEEKQEKQGEEEETKGEAGAVAAATKGKPAAAVDTAAIAAAAAAAATAAAAAATAAAALSAIAATAKGS